MIDGHGDDLFRFNGKVQINFSTNIPQNVNHDGLLEHLHECGAIFRNYPEPEPKSVEQHLATINGVSSENIIVTNGATEAIYLLAHLFEGKKSAIIVPTFREYQDAAGVFAHSISYLHSMTEIEGTDADVVWLCNPNNPTGQIFDRDDLLAENLVFLYSLTKQFMIPGLRIGYAIGPVRLFNALRRLRMPWSVNSLAIEAAHFLLNNNDGIHIDRQTLHEEALQLSDALTESGIEVEPTDCNFLLARLPYKSASELKAWMVENYGILIRDASNFEGLTPSHFRIAAQSRAENDVFIKAIKEWKSL